MDIHSDLRKVLAEYTLDKIMNNRFTQRISQGKLTQSQNQSSHFCLYFAAFDKINKQVFLGHHKKSHLWLFNGGHIDENEDLQTALSREIDEEWGYKQMPTNINIHQPDLLSITSITNQIQRCKEHLDIWYFINVNKNTFAPSDIKLKIEFFTYKWLNFSAAKYLVKDPATLQAISKMETIAD